MSNKPIVILALVVALVVIAIWATWTVAQDGPIEYYACVNNASGTIHMVSEGEDCSSNEILIHWNQTGPAAPAVPLCSDVTTGSCLITVEEFTALEERIKVLETTLMPMPTAEFTAVEIAGRVVYFKDLSTESPTSWVWDFGDGSSSTLQDPIHTYPSAGTFTVSLSVTNAFGSDIETKENYIVLVEPPPPPPDARLVFITREGTNGDIGGLVGADAFCQNEAAAAGLEGTFKAWLSTYDPEDYDPFSSPDERFVKSDTPYVLVNGEVVAENYSELTFNSLLYPIIYTADGQYSGFDTKVWTATTHTGINLGDATCLDWTNGLSTTFGGGYYTIAGNIDAYWSYPIGAMECSELAHLYCFEQ